jgi:hypothetical protein
LNVISCAVSFSRVNDTRVICIQILARTVFSSSCRAHRVGALKLPGLVCSSVLLIVLTAIRCINTVADASPGIAAATKARRCDRQTSLRLQQRRQNIRRRRQTTWPRHSPAAFGESFPPAPTGIDPVTAPLQVMHAERPPRSIQHDRAHPRLLQLLVDSTLDAPDTRRSGCRSSSSLKRRYLVPSRTARPLHRHPLLSMWNAFAFAVAVC